MRVVVPFDATNPKTRLSPLLDATERHDFARCMLRDVVDAVGTLASADVDVNAEADRAVDGDLDVDSDAEVDVDVDVISTAPVDLALDFDARSDRDPSVAVRVDDRPLDPVVDDAVAETVGADGDAGETGPLVVVMADLALATPEALARLVSTDGDVVLAPGRGVGTNALVVRTPDFRADFHGTSYLDHREAAAAVGTVGTVDSFRLATDVDEPADLVEAFVHGGARTSAWLAARFELERGDGGRVTLARR